MQKNHAIGRAGGQGSHQGDGERTCKLQDMSPFRVNRDAQYMGSLSRLQSPTQRLCIPFVPHYTPAMGFRISHLGDLARADFDDIIDVRSPSEYAEDHMPGAISLPVLSDDERARVGTIYKQVSPFDAKKIGAALVAKNAAAHIEGPLADRDGGWKPLVYCWRGGQRSGSFATILKQIGWRAEVVDGGYQSYRRRVHEVLYEQDMPSAVILLDGNTGTGKTDVLKRLAALGVQVIDLEGRANHRGSALGARGDQPSQKAFESALAADVAALDPAKPVVVEAESSRIGRLNLPPKLFEAMRAAPRVVLDVPVTARAEYLSRAYADVTTDPEELSARLEKLIHLQGRDRVQGWLDQVTAGDFTALAADLITHHYDARYAKVRARIGAETETVLSAERLDEAGLDRLAGQVAETISAR